MSWHVRKILLLPVVALPILLVISIFAQFTPHASASSDIVISITTSNGQNVCHGNFLGSYFLGSSTTASWDPSTDTCTISATLSLDGDVILNIGPGVKVIATGINGVDGTSGYGGVDGGAGIYNLGTINNNGTITGIGGNGGNGGNGGSSDNGGSGSAGIYNSGTIYNNGGTITGNGGAGGNGGSGVNGGTSDNGGNGSNGGNGGDSIYNSGTIYNNGGTITGNGGAGGNGGSGGNGGISGSGGNGGSGGSGGISVDNTGAIYNVDGTINAGINGGYSGIGGHGGNGGNGGNGNGVGSIGGAGGSGGSGGNSAAGISNSGRIYNQGQITSYGGKGPQGGIGGFGGSGTSGNDNAVGGTGGTGGAGGNAGEGGAGGVSIYNSGTINNQQTIRGDGGFGGTGGSGGSGGSGGAGGSGIGVFSSGGFGGVGGSGGVGGNGNKAGDGIANVGTINNEGTISDASGLAAPGGNGGSGGTGGSGGSGYTGGSGGFGGNGGTGGNGASGISVGSIPSIGQVSSLPGYGGIGGAGGPGSGTASSGNPGNNGANGSYGSVIISVQVVGGTVYNYCAGTISEDGVYFSSSSSSLTSCSTITFTENGLPSGAVWGVTSSWGPFVLPVHYSASAGNAVSVSVGNSIGSTGLNYTFDSPVTVSGLTEICGLTCSATNVQELSDATITASYLTTTTAVTCTPSSVSVGSSTQCEADVTSSGGSPTGTVSWYQSSQFNGLVTLSSSSCTLSNNKCSINVTPSLDALSLSGSTASDTVEAVYNGDSGSPSSHGTTALTITLPSLSVAFPSSPQGPVGTLIGLSGSGFSFSSTYNYCYEADTTNPTPCSSSNQFTTDASGNIPGPPVPFVTAKGSSIGLVVVSDPDTGAVIRSDAFTVTTPTITLSPSKGGEGTVVTVTGSKFTVNMQISNFTFNGVIPSTQDCTSQTTSSSGAFSCTFSVPSTYSSTNTVMAEGRDATQPIFPVPADKASASFTSADSTPPTTTETQSGTTGTNSWYISQVQVTLTATDNPGGSGIGSTGYSLDGAPQATYSGPFTVTGDGNHTLSFNSTDSAGNVELPHLTYIAIDTTSPVITVPHDVTQEATGQLTTVNLGTAAAIDAVDGPVTVTNNATVSYPVGVTEIQYSATDLAGNTATAYQKVTMTDTTPPSLQLPTEITVQATGPSGSNVSYKANATDLVDGPIMPECNPPSGSTFAYGNTTVTCTASDAHGNKATGTFDINVQNKIPPTMSITTPANNAMVNTSTVPVSGTASDTVSITRISWKVDSGSVSTVSGITPGPNVNWSFDTSALSPGTHTIQVNATDSAGLVAISSVSITYAAPSDSIPPPSGGGQATFTSSSGGFTSLESVPRTSLPTPPPPGNYPLGFFSWDITGFAPATSVTVTVTSPVPLHHQSHYFKLIGGAWVAIPVTVSGNTMTFTILDNGPYDGNPANGVISDPAAVANPTDGTVTGGGNIGKGTSLGLEVHSDLSKKDPIKGTLEYHDRYVRLDLQSHNMEFLSVDSTGTQATFVGTGTYDRHEMHGDHKGHDIRDVADTFLVSVSDPDRTGEHDKFSITVTNSTGNVMYQNSGTVKGHIEIHNADNGGHGGHNESGNENHGGHNDNDSGNHGGQDGGTHGNGKH